MKQVKVESHKSILVPYNQFFKCRVVTCCDPQHQLYIRVCKVLIPE